MPNTAIIKLNGKVHEVPEGEYKDDADVERTDSRGSDEVERPRYTWIEDNPAAQNYREFGAVLAPSGDLFRNGEYGTGLVLVVADNTTRLIQTAKEFAPRIVDRVDLSIYLDGKPKGGMPTVSHLNSMLMSEEFLSNFTPVDRVSRVPSDQRDFSLTQPGFNDGGRDFRVVYLGDSPSVLNTMDRILAFLGVMDFASEADRTNAVAACLTVMLRHHFPGGKPIVLATATKSFSGKDTVILFAAGQTRMASISYQSADWALERSFVGVLNQDPETGVVVVENARLNARDRFISSAFIERFATDPEPFLFSTGTGPARRRRNDIVVAISTNYGSVSEDILNRSLPIHLAPKGNVSDRESPIGNPKLEFLPQYCDEIAAEFRGMIDRWNRAEQPMDREVRHPFSEWAAVVGGILKVNGFYDFLANYGQRKLADDPVREALAFLGAELLDKWERPETMALKVGDLGLTKQLIPSGDREGIKAKTRGLGKVLSNHEQERFTAQTETESIVFELRKKRGRFKEGNVHTRYCFAILDRTSRSDDE